MSQHNSKKRDPFQRPTIKKLERHESFASPCHMLMMMHEKLKLCQDFLLWDVSIWMDKIACWSSNMYGACSCHIFPPTLPLLFRHKTRRISRQIYGLGWPSRSLSISLFLALSVVEVMEVCPDEGRSQALQHSELYLPQSTGGTEICRPVNDTEIFFTLTAFCNGVWFIGIRVKLNNFLQLNFTSKYLLAVM